MLFLRWDRAGNSTRRLNKRITRYFCQLDVGLHRRTVDFRENLNVPIKYQSWTPNYLKRSEFQFYSNKYRGYFAIPKYLFIFLFQLRSDRETRAEEILRLHLTIFIIYRLCRIIPEIYTKRFPSINGDKRNVLSEKWWLIRTNVCSKRMSHDF